MKSVNWIKATYTTTAKSAIVCLTAHDIKRYVSYDMYGKALVKHSDE